VGTQKMWTFGGRATRNAMCLTNTNGCVAILAHSGCSWASRFFVIWNSIDVPVGCTLHILQTHRKANALRKVCSCSKQHLEFYRHHLVGGTGGMQQAVKKILGVMGMPVVR
jgi:hypothetical protein